METSFRRMMEAFPPESPAKPQSYQSPYYSQGFLPRLRAILDVRRLRADLFHITGDVHFLALGLPGRRTILTIHDLGFLRDYSGWKRRLLQWLWLDWPVRRCRYITAVSEATRADILRRTQCPPDKVLVIPTLIGGHFRRVDKPFQTEKPLILHVGLAPNKNLEGHARALKDIPCILLVIGKLEDSHRQVLESCGIDYRHACNLSDEAMAAAYAEADMLLFASTLEGFGMPILEAQTVGRPVVTSHCSSMPEVAGSGACLVDPFNPDSIRAGILRVLSDEGYRQALVEAGFENIRRFDPALVARQYESLYLSCQ